MNKYLASGLAALVATGMSLGEPLASTYDRTKQLFQVSLENKYERKARQIVSNTQQISRSPQKRQFLYNNLETRLKAKFNLPKVPKLFGFVDQEHEGAFLGVFLQAVDKVKQTAGNKYHLPDSFVFSAINKEGHIFSSYSNHRSVNYNGGFMLAGLDWFGGEFKDIKAAGFLPESFKTKFNLSYNINEKGERVPSARFKDVDSIFKAFTATLLYRQHRFLKDCKRFGIDSSKLSDEEKLFWTYFYYNGGEGKGRSVLRRNSSEKKLRGVFNKRGQYGIAGNSFYILSSMEWLDKSGCFDQSPKGKYWWSGGSGVSSVTEPAKISSSGSEVSFERIREAPKFTVFRHVPPMTTSAVKVSKQFNAWDKKRNKNRCVTASAKNVVKGDGKPISKIPAHQKGYVKIKCKK